MDDRRLEFKQQPDPELEDLLAEGLSAPPEDVLREVTPWRRAMNRVLTGLALTSVTLNFLCLNYLLPAVGYVQLLLGLRALRRENGFFQTWWAVNLARSGWFFFCLLRSAVPGSQAFFALPPLKILGYSAIVLQFVQLFCLWRGLKAIQRKAGLPPEASGGALIVWHLVAVGLALTEYSGWLLGLPVIIAYFFILYLLYHLSKDLDEAGYTVQPASVQVDDRVLVWGITAVLAAGLAVCYLFLNRFPMDWQPVDPAEHSQVTELEGELLELGFPEEVLADLTRSDILACAGAVRVEVDRERHSLTMSWDDDTPKPLAMTHVAVELAGEPKSWRVFHYFAWDSGTRFYGSEAFQLWTLYDHMEGGWSKLADPDGRLLYDRDGTTYCSPYHSLGVEAYATDSMFFGPQSYNDPMASFSFPRNGECCRGYVTYEAEEVQEGWLLSSWINYVHQQKRFVYPAQTAREWQMSGAWNGDGQPFLRIQTAIQFYPFEWPPS